MEMHVGEILQHQTSFQCPVLHGNIVNESFRISQGRSRWGRKLKLSKGMHGPGVGVGSWWLGLGVGI